MEEHKFSHGFFQTEVDVAAIYGIALKRNMELSNTEVDSLWKRVVEVINQSNPVYKNDTKKLVGLANRMRLMIDPEFADSHPVIKH